MARKRKFGKWIYTLKWDSRTFNAPDTKAMIKQKSRIAKLYAEDYRKEGYNVRIITSSDGKNFTVWTSPKMARR